MAVVKQKSHQTRKRELRNILCISILRAVEDAAVHHAGVVEIAVRLANHAGNIIKVQNVSLIDIMLAQALSEWTATLRDYGVQEAYLEFCRSISDELPRLLSYCVSSKSIIYPFNRTQWDCLSSSFTDWVCEHNLDRCQIEVIETASPTSNEIEFCRHILASRIFSRSELKKLFGIRTEIHRFHGSVLP